MKKHFIFIIIYLFSWASANAQGLIKGSITDQDKSPLPGANIFIHELNKGTVSDEHGQYLLGNIPNGKLRVQYSYLGYTTEVKTIFFQ